LKLYKHKIISN